MNKRTIWLKGLEIRKMTNKQIANYEFSARITNPDEPSDHELLLQLVEKINKIEENQIKDHDLLLKVIKLNNLRTE